MLSKQSIFTTSLFATVSMSIALPSGLLTKREDSPDYSICDYTFNSDEERISLWQDSGAGEWLDDFISSYGEAQWVQRVDEETLTSGASTWDCTGEDTFCGPPAECSEFVDAGVGPAYWVMLSATKARDALAYLHERWQDTGIVGAFEIDTIVDGFQEPKDSFNVLALCTAAMSLGSAVFGPIGAEAAIVSSALTVAGASFGYAGATKGSEIDPEADIQDQFASAWSAAQEALHETMQVAFTGGQEGYPSTSLPNLATNWENPITNWFAGGRWLYDTVSLHMDPVAEEMEKRARQGIVGQALKARPVMVVLDTYFDNEDDCNQREGPAIWLTGLNINGETVDHCAVLEVITSENWVEGDWLETEYTDKMINKYGIDLAETYRESVRCAMEGDGSIQGSLAELSTQPPLCFWSFPVVRGSQGDGDYAETICDIDINTTDRDPSNACPSD